MRLIIVPLGLVAVALCGTACSSGNSDPNSGTVSTLTVSPHEASITVGGATQLTATAENGNGDQITCNVTWTSSDPAFATVSTTGNVTGVAVGVVVITASCQDRDDTAAITVTAAPALHVGQREKPTS